MSRLPHLLIAAMLMAGVAAIHPARTETAPAPGVEGQPPVTGTPSADERKAARQKAREERKAQRREERKAARAAKLPGCRDQAKQQNLRGDERRAFLRKCVRS